jgi:AcrR family transcriptional regulator
MTTAGTYHHGDLPTALLDAVDEVVRERGLAAVTLRAAARRAGVSHTAPAHHFGDKAGLLTAYAAQGFAALRDRLRAANDQQADESGLTAIGLAYVRFAIEEPGRFQAMFRPELVHVDEPAYRDSCDAAFAVLLDSVAELRDDLAPEDPQLLYAATGAWSIVHGFATLWLDGNLDERVTALEPGAAAEAAFEAFGLTMFLAAGVEPPS